MKNDKIAAVHAAVTSAFIQALDEGTANPQGWVAPWCRAGGAVNVATGRRYQGGNAVLLTLLGSGPWGTYRQWAAVGGQVRKGESATWILAPRTGKAKDDQDQTIRTWTYFRAVPVFGASQQDGWTAPDAPVPTDQPVPLADAFCDGVARVIPTTVGGAAYYTPSTDTVTLPARETFTSHGGYYGTAAHEYGHATGHSSRLNRDGMRGYVFGSPEYAREELVAEFTAAFIGTHLGVATGLREDHRDYLAHWLKVAQGDSEAVWRAAADAQKAAAWLIEASGIETEADAREAVIA